MLKNWPVAGEPWGYLRLAPSPTIMDFSRKKKIALSSGNIFQMV